MYSIIEIHNDHKLWKSKLDFYKDEVTFFFKELNKVFDKDKNNLQKMEIIDEYEAILDKKSEAIEDIYLRINEAEKSIAVGKSSDQLQNVHHQIALDMLKLHRNYDTTKKGFKMFAAHND